MSREEFFQAPVDNPLPREIAQGVFWLGECYIVPFDNRVLHSYQSTFMVVGEECTALIETGMPGMTGTLDQLATSDQVRDSAVRYLFATHSEMAHSGGLGSLLARYPEAHAYGDVSDLHLVWPEYSDRMIPADPGDRFDLGGREIVVIEGVFRDLVTTRWFLDSKTKTLFPADGFAYSHYHDENACGHLAEEVPELSISDNMVAFALAAFNWASFVDMEPYVARLRTLVFDELDVKCIAPTHGLPIGDPRSTMPLVLAGMRNMPINVQTQDLDEDVF